ncbi:MAG: DNA polymerase III subunit gamma/tau [Clostridia bacterium]|nr:DNA polymerase III subunit gamma/tau [Clostridia bacterium]
MYQALYRKYRPATFDDVCGQDHITTVLKAQIEKGRTTHAYMFCGCRGTGKTTCAKIFARAVNCEHPVNGEPCNECPTCRGIREERIFDVVEMDAASNNGVENVRSMISEVQYLPTEAKKKVYIIDEVHMMTASAFNALLKTIEEPPEHLIFIFATTDVNKVPATILSRCQRFDFKRIVPEIIRDRVLYVAEKEGIRIDREAASVIARLADGAMRDAMSLLEVCQGHDGAIGQKEIRKILGLGSREQVISLCRAITRLDTEGSLRIVSGIYEGRSDFKQIVGDLIGFYRDLLVIDSVPNAAEFINADADEFAALREMAASLPKETLLFQARLLEEFYASYDRSFADKRAAGEILMIRLCRKECAVTPEALASRLALLEKAVSSGAPVKTAPADVAPVERENIASETKQSAPAAAQAVQAGEVPYEARAQLKNVMQSDLSVKHFLQAARYVRDGHTLKVLVPPLSYSILQKLGTDQAILKNAAALTPDITSVLLVESKEEVEAEPDGLDEL